jgi:hypothetical protein
MEGQAETCPCYELSAGSLRTAWIPRAIAYLMGLSGPHLSRTGLGGRLRGFFANAHDRNRAGRSPEPGVDDVAGRRRLGDAGF